MPLRNLLVVIMLLCLLTDLGEFNNATSYTSA
jgi:hypothetical protein